MTSGRRKHAFAPRALRDGLNWPRHRHASARQRAFCPSRRLRHASGTSVAGDDPVNASDPSGLSTNAYCVSLQGIFAKIVGVGGQLEGCLLEASTGEIGVTLTIGGGAVLAADHSWGVALVNKKSNANYISQLSGWFDFYSAGAAGALGLPLSFGIGPGVSLGGYIGCVNGQQIVGGAFGVGVARTGVSLLGGRSYTFYTTFGGLTAFFAKILFAGIKYTAGVAAQPAAWLVERLTLFIANHIPESWIPSS